VQDALLASEPVVGEHVGEHQGHLLVEDVSRRRGADLHRARQPGIGHGNGLHLDTGRRAGRPVNHRTAIGGEDRDHARGQPVEQLLLVGDGHELLGDLVEHEDVAARGVAPALGLGEEGLRQLLRLVHHRAGLAACRDGAGVVASREHQASSSDHDLVAGKQHHLLGERHPVDDGAVAAAQVTNVVVAVDEAQLEVLAGGGGILEADVVDVRPPGAHRLLTELELALDTMLPQDLENRHLCLRR